MGPRKCVHRPCTKTGQVGHAPSAQLRIRAANTKTTKATAVQPKGFIHVSPRLYALCAEMPASTSPSAMPTKMKKPAKRTSRPTSELMSKGGPLEGPKGKALLLVPGEATGGAGHLVPVQLAGWTCELLKPN